MSKGKDKRIFYGKSLTGDSVTLMIINQSFKYEDDVWKQIDGDLEGENNFGQSVAISPDGTLIAIGATGPTGIHAVDNAPYNIRGTVSLYEIQESGLNKIDEFIGPGSVSYTHLTLPTNA